MLPSQLLSRQQKRRSATPLQTAHISAVCPHAEADTAVAAAPRLDDRAIHSPHEQINAPLVATLETEKN